MSLAESIERLEIQAEKQQLLLKYVKNTAKDKSEMSKGITRFASQGSAMTKAMEERSTPMNEIRSKGRNRNRR